MFKTRNNILQQMLFAITVIFAVSTNNLVQSAAGDRCKTPNGEDATCTSLYSCKSIIEAIASKNERSLQFAERSHCDPVGRTFLVCCGSRSTYVEEKPKATETVKEIDKKDLLPSRQLCGFQSKDDRFESRNNTQIDEYPWMALLSFKNRETSEVSFICAGSLINRRYVLTAAHCVRPRLPLELKSVRLGEYDISSTGIDCVENPDYDECTEPPVDLDIEEVIIHEKANRKENDIALIRLSKPVRYSDYIRPICLPFKEDTLDKFGKDVITSGWGKIDAFKETTASVKKNSKTVIETLENCTKGFSNARAVVTEKELCVRHLVDGGACVGDSGGPMMSAKKFQWYQQGIVSYGTFVCGKGGLTAGPKITHYIDWILSRLKP